MAKQGWKTTRSGIPILTLEAFPSVTLNGGDVTALAWLDCGTQMQGFPNHYHSTVFALGSIEFALVNIRRDRMPASTNPRSLAYPTTVPGGAAPDLSHLICHPSWDKH